MLRRKTGGTPGSVKPVVRNSRIVASKGLIQKEKTATGDDGGDQGLFSKGKIFDHDGVEFLIFPVVN